MTITTFLDIISPTIGVLSLAGAYLKAISGSANRESLQDGNAELRGQVDDKNKIIFGLQKDTELYKSQLAAASDAAMKAEAARIEALKLAQNRPAFDQLGPQMMKQHKELLAAIGRQNTAYNKGMLKLTGEVSKLIEKVSYPNKKEVGNR